MKKIICIAIVIAFSCKSTSIKKTTLWMIGDSTMAKKDAYEFPKTGWGTPFSYYFDETIAVQNKARNGYSTKMFIDDGLWQSVVKSLNANDYVFIQFGHNDEKEQSPEKYTPPAQFQQNLIRFIEDARSKNAFPILITPVTRRNFDESGIAVETHPVYSDLVKDVAANYNVPMIDLDEKSLALLNQLGPEASKSLYMIFPPGEYNNYPHGSIDDTHFTQLGAQKIAGIVIDGIKDLNLPLAARIIQ